MHVSPSHLPLPRPRAGPSADGSLLLLQGSKEREAVLLVSQNPPSAPCISLSQCLPWVASPSHPIADRRRAGRTQAADYRENEGIMRHVLPTFQVKEKRWAGPRLRLPSPSPLRVCQAPGPPCGPPCVHPPALSSVPLGRWGSHVSSCNDLFQAPNRSSVESAHRSLPAPRAETAQPSPASSEIRGFN